MIAISMSFPNLAAKLMNARTAIQTEMVVAMQFNRGMLFDSEGAYNGHTPWDPLILRSGQIMAQRGVLKKSIAPMTGEAGPGGYVRMDSEGTIAMGTNVAYAALMNYGTKRMPGGVLRPVHAKALRIPIPAGKSATVAAKGIRRMLVKKGKDPNFIFVQWVRIPERRFDTISAQDKRDFIAAAKAAIAEALK